MKIPSLAVKRPVAFTCVFAAIFILGAFALSGISVDMLPEMDMPEITVLTIWNGASPSDVEQRVTKTIEDNLSVIEGIKNIISKSRNNVSSVTLEFEWGADLDARLGDVRDKLDMAERDLPDDAEKPMVFRMSMSNMPVMISVITAGDSFLGLRKFADNTLKEQIQRVEGVGSVIVAGGREREISVTLDPLSLEAYRLSTGDILSALERENVNVPAGTLTGGATNYNVRVPARFQNIRDIETIIILTRGGIPIRLKDIASVRDSFKEQSGYAWIASPGAPITESVNIMIFKNNDANTVGVVRGVEKRIEEIHGRFPSDARYETVFNQAEEIENSLEVLTGSLLEGFVLVFFVTWFFMRRFWASVIICVSIPVSLLMTCIVMRLAGYGMNVFTLTALAMAVGLVVDNAIVSTDQIMYHMELGESKEEASVLGANEVAGALAGSTSTSVVVLIPLFFAGGMIGVFFSPVAAVMASSLVCSLMVAVSFVPMFASKIRNAGEDNFSVHRFSKKFTRMLERLFSSVLDKALDHYTAVLFAAFVFLLLTLKGAGFIGSELTPATDSGEIEISYELPEGTRLETTDAATRDIMAWAKENVPELAFVYAEDGEDETGYGSIFGDTGSNVGSVSLKLVRKKDRNRSSFAVARQLRDALDRRYAFQSFTVMVDSGMSPNSGKPFVVEVYGDELREILDAAARIKDMLAGIDGTADVTVEQKPESPEIHVRIDRDKAALFGIGTARVAETLRALIYGTEAKEKYWEGEYGYDIRVRMVPEFKNDLRLFDRISVINSSGEPVRLPSIASLTFGDGPSEIFRKNRRRYVTVEANLYGRSLGEVLKDAREGLDAMTFPGAVALGWGGDVGDQDETFDKFGILLALAVVLCYMVMAAQYEAYSDPLIIMITVPFAFTGMVLIFLALDLYISMQVIFGMLMLTGVVVNHAIIYLDYVNLLRTRGAPLRRSLLEAAKRRLRPIMMTVMTTFFGMLPLAVGNGEGSEQWNAMAVCYMSGLLFSTLVTLILAPVLYYLVETKLRRKPRFAEAVSAAKNAKEAIA